MKLSSDAESLSKVGVQIIKWRVNCQNNNVKNQICITNGQDLFI